MSYTPQELKTLEVVALLGAPNSGKTTLYNWLTNSRFKTVNYPGATIEYSIGRLAAHFSSPSSADLLIMDTPGTYSLFPKSADEEVTQKALYEHPDTGPLKKLVVVVDGTQLARHLLLAEQVREAGFAMVIAVTMNDLLRKQGLAVDRALLSEKFGAPVVLVDGLLGGGVAELIGALRDLSPQSGRSLPPWSEVDIELKARKIEGISDQALSEVTGKKGSLGSLGAIYDRTARIDAVLLHPVWGLMLFALIMFALFSSIFWLAKPFMDLINLGFALANGWVTEVGGGSLWSRFVGDGLINSFGAVMVFVPQIFMLFFGIGILESSGYLARAATLIDRPFSKLGMSGRSFVPILSGFACAVPAIMATRNISSSRDRWITNFIIPLMTCSARLPVYALLLSFLYKDQPPWKAGVALAGIYFGSLILGAAAAAFLNKIIKKSGLSLFMMELPLYRRPIWRTLLSGTLTRTRAYVRRAGPAIFVFASLVWVGTTFPNYDNPRSSSRLENSYLSHMGRYIEPVFTPMGGDWRTGVGLLSAFAARETFVSSLAILFNATDDSDESQSQGLLKSMSEAQTANGQALFTFSSVLGLVVFFMIAMQCLSTFAIAYKETKSAAFAWTQLIVFNVVAYGMAVGMVQGLRALGVA